jgi:phosphotransferase system HPr-like phosphotransfer protein
VISLTTEGDQEDQALAALGDLIGRNFEEKATA